MLSDATARKAGAACLGKKAKVQPLRLDPSKAPRSSAAQMANKKAASSACSSLVGASAWCLDSHAGLVDLELVPAKVQPPNA